MKNTNRYTSNVYHIGIDDTDSAEGMCTTFLCYCLVHRLQRARRRTAFLDFPNLIRHNPNIPWKTRGNASIVLRIKSEIPPKELFSICERILLEHAKSEKANSGLVIFQGKTIPEELKDFSRRSLSSVLSIKEAKALIDEYGMLSLGLRTEQGLVGALSGIGNTLEQDHTYELIAYRNDCSIRRKIDKSRIIEMSEATFPETFSNFDIESGRIMIMPHGPDPVLCGVRGENPAAVKRAFRMIQPLENCSGWMIYRSNQGTGEHLRETIRLDRLKAYSSGVIEGVVSTKPRMEQGGHLFFRVTNGLSEIECACYEPTGSFRAKALSLIIGDRVELAGGIRKSTSKHPKVLNLEYFRPLNLAKKTNFHNPRCPDCSSTMKSNGKNQGYECKKCGQRVREGERSEVILQRELKSGQIYIPPIGAHRHLTKPEHRYNLNQKIFSPTLLSSKWASFSDLRFSTLKKTKNQSQSK